MIQESWLDSFHKSINLPNSDVLSRRDRSEDANRGGVIAFVRKDVKNMNFLCNFPDAERSWHIIYRDSGSIALCNWYHSPSEDLRAIDTLPAEHEEMSKHADAFCIAGDLNVHHASWLRYSRCDSVKGSRL